MSVLGQQRTCSQTIDRMSSDEPSKLRQAWVQHRGGGNSSERMSMCGEWHMQLATSCKYTVLHDPTGAGPDSADQGLGQMVPITIPLGAGLESAHQGLGS